MIVCLSTFLFLALDVVVAAESLFCKLNDEVEVVVLVSGVVVSGTFSITVIFYCFKWVILC